MFRYFLLFSVGFSHLLICQEAKNFFSLGIGYNDLNPKQLKAWSEPALRFQSQVLGIEIPTQRNYPGNVSFNASLLRTITFMKAGISVEIISTQERRAYQDYAGRFTINGKLQSKVINFLLDYDELILTRFYAGVGGFVGLNFKTWKYSDKIVRNSTNETLNRGMINSNNFNALCGPRLKIEYYFNSLGVSTVIGYQFDFARPLKGDYSNYFLKRNNVNFTDINGRKLRADCTGLFLKINGVIRF